MDVDDAANLRASLERDRALATTPLLPPLVAAHPLEEEDTSSPLELPDVAPSPRSQSPAPGMRPCPISSPISPDILSPLHALFPECDEWSNFLGHANFTIFPEPYRPSVVELDTIRKFVEDWDKARVSYTQHLLRTGEHYGTTSKIYRLTEAKWAGIEDSWKDIHKSLLNEIRAVITQQPQEPQHQQKTKSKSKHQNAASINGAPGNRNCDRDSSHDGATSKRVSFTSKKSCEDKILAGMEWRRVDEDLPTTICKMLEETGKFPGLSDNGIVGPMERDEVMVRTHSEERKRSRFWRSLIEKVRK